MQVIFSLFHPFRPFSSLFFFAAASQKDRFNYLINPLRFENESREISKTRFGSFFFFNFITKNESDSINPNLLCLILRYCLKKKKNLFFQDMRKNIKKKNLLPALIFLFVILKDVSLLFLKRCVKMSARHIFFFLLPSILYQSV